MNPDTKEQLRSVGGTLGLVAAGAATVGVITYLTLAPAKPRATVLQWDYPAAELPTVIFEISRKTNLTAPWQVLTNVTATNRVVIPQSGPQAFYVITRVMNREWTNVQAVWDGVKQ